MKSGESNVTGMFRAYTLRPKATNRMPWGFRRQRLIDSINRSLPSGAHVVIAAPMGAGKTTLAIQWAMQTGKPVGFVTGHSVDRIPQQWLSAPTPYSAAMANMLNALSMGVEHWTDIESALSILKATDSDPLPIILDGFGALRPHVSEYMVRDAYEVVEAALSRQVVFLLRGMGSESLALMSRGVGVRTILNDDLSVTREEVVELHSRGMLGDVSLEYAQSVRAQEYGWMSGLISSCTNDRTLDSVIMNELLLRQPIDVRHAIMALISLPVATEGLWHRLMEHLGRSTWRIQNVLAQIPSLAVGLDEPEYVFPETLKRTIRRIAAGYIDLELLDTLCGISLRWYIENNRYDAVASLVQRYESEVRLERVVGAANLSDEVIEDIRKLNTTKAEEIGSENERLWLRVQSFEDLDTWPRELIDAQSTFKIWRESDDPMWNVRGYVAMARQAWVYSQSAECLIAAKKVLDTAPNELYEERFLAVTLAYGTDTLLGGQDRDVDWMSLAADEFVRNPGLIDQWHRFVRPLQLGFMATQGGLQTAESECLSELEECRVSDPQSAAQYAALLAHLSLERDQFEQAYEYVQIAKSLFPEIQHTIDYCMVDSACLIASRRYTLASDAIQRAGPSRLTNPIGSFRKATTQAMILLLEGNTDGALLLIRNTPRLADYWPRFFGEIHPALLEAQILGVQGENQQAIDMAASVALEAHRRRHVAFEVQARSTIAYLHHLAGRTDMRDESISLAKLMAGKNGFSAAFRVLGHDVRAFETPRPDTSTKEEGVGQGNSQQMTYRELTILRLADKGFTNPQIAQDLFISVSTVKSHMANISTKLDTRTRSESVRVARDRGLLP